jgi:valyl-tRNA synthetase
MKMKTEIPKQFDPQEAQNRWLAFWHSRGYFHSRPDSARKPFCIVIPPPNVTGALHMGHALNNIPQDVLIRWRRMQGFNTLWMPGTDHAGIGTQAVVERRIREEENKTRYDVGREELVRRIWQWKDQYESRILRQLKEIGCSCDWARTRFTLDPICARAVRQTFFDFFRAGLIFRGKRLVNWDTQLQTAVADDEMYHETVKGGFWTFRYPVKGANEFIRFSTTRPETMLGDTAVAVHPDDPRYQHLTGKMVTIPLVNREIPIIADGLLVDPKLGTGAVKVTPAHDPNDYACGQRHDLPMINILNPDGTINANGGSYAGLTIQKAREQVVADMEKLGFFDGREDREIDLAHSDRSKTPIEPFLSDQWFVLMKDREGKPGLAQMAIDAVKDGRVKFFPERYAKTYIDWLSEKRDWCISRQLWWGHQIPVWQITLRADLYRQECGGIQTSLRRVKEEFGRELQDFASACGTPDELAFAPYQEKSETIFFICAKSERAQDQLNQLYKRSRWYAAPKVMVQAGDATQFEVIPQLVMNDPRKEPELRLVRLLADMGGQDPDVLDTWFSSALWPHSTMGWPEETPELRYYYPTNVLVTNRDIITLWVARMVMTSLFNLNQVPFHHVFIHPQLADAFGERMSKSKGNGVDPVDIVDRYGTDALRFGIINLCTETQDSRMPVSNVCPYCDTLVPVRQEHMYMRTRKVTCPNCKKPFRPGGPWPADDPDLKTAKQASDKFELGRNFANKLWNAARFLLMNLEDYKPGAIRPEELPIEDRWILSRLATATEAVTNHLEDYHLSEVARAVYEFTWSEFCDWFLEMSKGRLRDLEGRPIVQRVLVGVLDVILRLVHPIMPFVAESIWQLLAEAAFERGLPTPEPAAESVVIAPWPNLPANWKDPAMEIRIARMQELVRFVREVRNNNKLDSQLALDVTVCCNDAIAADFQSLAQFIRTLAGVGLLNSGPDQKKPPQSVGHVVPDFEAYVSLKGLIDVEEEVKRLTKLLVEKKKYLQSTEAKLNRSSFVDKAPPNIVQQQKELVLTLKEQIKVIEANLRELQQE